jgi:hypothetical protein
MALVFTGYATVNTDISPILNTTKLNAVLATAPQNMTVANCRTLFDLCIAVKGGEEYATVIGSLMSLTTGSLVLTGYAVPSNDVSPIFTASVIDAIFAKAPQNWTFQDLSNIRWALNQKIGGEESASILGNLFT